MTNEQRKALRVDGYAERLVIDNDGFRFEVGATIDGYEYTVTTQTEGDEQLVRDTMIELLTKLDRAAANRAAAQID